jgi:hypothetical protein
MIEALPDPFQLKKVVGNATGFLGGVGSSERIGSGLWSKSQRSVWKMSHTQGSII